MLLYFRCHVYLGCSMFNHVAAAAAHLCRCLHGSCFLELSEIVHYLVVLVLLPKILIPPGSFPMFDFEILQRIGLKEGGWFGGIKVSKFLSS